MTATNPHEQSNQQSEYSRHAERTFAQSDEQREAHLDSLGTTLLSEFSQAELDRRDTELRWLEDLRQFRGIYSAEVEARIGANRSKAFVRKTRVKIKTVDAKMDDFLFPANGSRNWEIASTPKPSVSKEQRAQLRKDLMLALTQPGQPRAQIDDDMVEKAIKDSVESAAKEMRKTIDDQLVECKYRTVAKQVVHSGNLYGTGIMKAPLVERKVRTRYVQNPDGSWQMKTETFTVPFVDFVPVWRWYPDMQVTELEPARFAYERHLLSKVALAKLADRKTFDKQKIVNYIKSNPDGVINKKHFETDLRTLGDRQTQNELKNGQYEVLERWGYLSGEQLRECCVKVPESRLHEQFFSNVWLLPDGQVIKAVLQPINGITWPYHIYYYDKDETSIFGEGLASIMRDDQDMINAGTRMIIDNAAITSGPQLEVNMRLISNKENATEFFPFKVWPRSGEDAGSPAIRAINIDSHINELGGIVEMFHNNADETTAVPRYAYGENETQGAAGTARGMSMLMGNQNIVMKDQFMNYDEGVTSSFIKAMYHWNMQFSKNPKIKGDFDVVASGAMALMAKEIRAQQLDSFAAQVANPMDAPYIKRDNLLRQRAEAHDLVNVVKTQEEVEQEMNNEAAKKMAAMQEMQQKLAMETMGAQLAKLQAEISNIAAKAATEDARALRERLSAMYEAMQAAGIAIATPGAAAAADTLLRSAGYRDADGGNLMTVPPGAQAPAMPQEQPPVPDASTGKQAGIQTPELADG